MKNIYFIFCMIILGTSCNPKNLPTVANITENQILIKCSHLTTKEDIANIRSKLEKYHNLNFDCSNCKYNTEDKLEAFFASISQDGTKLATCSADLMSLQFKYYGFEMEFKDGQMIYGKSGSFEE